jgi:hypothetical protein
VGLGLDAFFVPTFSDLLLLDVDFFGMVRLDTKVIE